MLLNLATAWLIFATCIMTVRVILEWRKVFSSADKKDRKQSVGFYLIPSPIYGILLKIFQGEVSCHNAPISKKS